MKILCPLVLLLAGLFASSAMAATAPLKLEQIKVQQEQIRSDVIAKTGRYRNMSESTRTELLSRQDQLLRMIGDKQDPNELSKAQRLQAFNTLEWIEAAINNAKDERMVCTRERQTGSLRTTTVCKTSKQIKDAHERARRQMEGSMPIDI